MKYLICITVFFLFILSANGNDNVDTVRFVNDTAKFATQPKVSYIVYAEKESDTNTLKDILLPVIMLLLGIGIDRFLVWRGDRKKAKKTGKRWIAELRSLLKPIQSQKGSFSSFINEYCEIENKYEVPNIAIFRSIDGSKFNSLGKEDLYDYLENIKGVDYNDEYQEITNIISTLEFTYSQLIEQWDEFRRRSSDLVEQYNTTVLKYRTLLSDLVSYADDHKIEKTDLEELIRLYEDTFNNKEKLFNIFKSKDEFIESSLAIIRTYQVNPGSMRLIHTLVDCLDCIEALKNEKIYIKSNLDLIIKVYEMVETTINQVLAKLDNKL